MATEQPSNIARFTIQLNASPQYQIYSPDGTATLYESNPANIYTLGCILDGDFCMAQNTLAVSNYNNVIVAAGSGIATYNFPVTAVNCSDTAVYLCLGNYPRPGTSYVNYIAYRNNGNQTVSGTIAFTKPASLTINSISQAGAVATPTGFMYNFSNLLPSEDRFFYVDMQVPPIPGVALGQQLQSSVTISIPPGDIDPNNNEDFANPFVIGAYDPNQMHENHGEEILFPDFTANDQLTYTIEFENTGNANAINVRIAELLDPKLDETSIKMVNASNDYVLQRTGSNLEWQFNGINLPPATTNTNTGKGQLTYTVKPKPGYAVGDIIPNTAHIYFDTNPAIQTNTWNTQFVNVLSKVNFNSPMLRYYPNPVKNKLTISNTSAIQKVTFISALGQKVLEQQCHTLQTEVDVNGLPSGIYMVKVLADGATETFKVVKQ